MKFFYQLFTVFFLCMMCSCFNLHFSLAQPSGLMVNFLREPSDALITDATPSFCWIVSGYEEGITQSAYQILVGDDSLNVAAGKGNRWNSGKVACNSSCNIFYKGQLLEPYRKYWWAVKYWTNKGDEGLYSRPQAFITGNINKKDTISHWDNKPDGTWRLEDRQHARFHKKAPETLWEMNPGHYIADFGKAAFATLQLSFYSYHSGDTVHVNLAERGTHNHLPHKKPGITSIAYKETFIITKEGWHTYTVQLPRYISHYPNSQVLAGHMPEVLPFRYAEIINVPSSLDRNDVNQLALYYYFDDEASHFVSSNKNINQVWELCKYTLKATPFLSLYADGNRERMPYEADAYIQQLGHYSVDRDYGIARYTWQFLLFNASWPTEWQTHTLMMAWKDYIYTGNAEWLKKYYPHLRAKTLMALEDKHGLISTRTGKVTDEFLASIHYRGNHLRDIVDWPPGRPSPKEGTTGWRNKLTAAGERDNYEFKDYNTVVNAFYYHGIETMRNIAHVVGNKKDEKMLSKKLKKLRKSFNNHFFDEVKGVYIDGIGSSHASLHANMFPLAFGLVDEEHVSSVIDHIKSKGMVCSVYGAQYLLEGLFDHGEGSYAMQLMTSEGKRSWMNMIKVGATMTTEAWDEMYKPNLTWNHAWGSAPANILVRKVAGIEPALPGFQKVTVRPRLALLNVASFKTPTIVGHVHVNWELKDGVYHVKVAIPENMEAEMKLPGSKQVSIPSGQYVFEVDEKNIID